MKSGSAMSTPLSDPTKLPRHDVMCIDCKSFYASCEAVARGEDPLSANIAVLSREESSGGLILAASPYTKQEYGVKLGTRKFELKPAMDINLVEPHMARYIQKNYEINLIYRQFTDDAHWFPYSIDESFIDVGASHKIFGSNFKIAQAIQKKVKAETGIVTTVGMGENPLLAKLALDNAAKRKAPWIARWTYANVPETIWKIPNLTDMWGIGNAYANKLRSFGIYSVYDLAHADVNMLKRRLGVMGEQLYYHAWGIDYSLLERRYLPRSKSKGYGNSQVLMKDYTDSHEIELVLREIADQVSTRLRKDNVECEIVQIEIGFGEPDAKGRGHYSTQMHIQPTNSSRGLQNAVKYLFEKSWNKQMLRSLGVRASKLSIPQAMQLDLFEDPDMQLQSMKLDTVIDKIRNRYGFKALMRASSLSEGATALARTDLVGGHKA